MTWWVDKYTYMCIDGAYYCVLEEKYDAFWRGKNPAGIIIFIELASSYQVSTKGHLETGTS